MNRKAAPQATPASAKADVYARVTDRIVEDLAAGVRAPGQNDWPMCVAGENACPPEDVGGPPGYMDFLEAMHNPADEQHADYWRRWGGPFDATAFSINAANMAIHKLR